MIVVDFELLWRCEVGNKLSATQLTRLCSAFPSLGMERTAANCFAVSLPFSNGFQFTLF